MSIGQHYGALAAARRALAETRAVHPQGNGASSLEAASTLLDDGSRNCSHQQHPARLLLVGTRAKHACRAGVSRSHCEDTGGVCRRT